MSNQQNRNFRLGLGIIAGTALGMWLNSAQGRRVRKNTQEKAVKLNKQASEYLSSQSGTIREKTNKFYEQARATINKSANQAVKSYNTGVENAATFAENKVDGSEAALKKGIQRAKETLKTSQETIASQLDNKAELVEAKAVKAKRKLKAASNGVS
jgi:hypothetical protein